MPELVRRVDVAGVTLQITEVGTGLPVICCHGFPGLGYSYRRQLPAIADAGYRAIAVDMLGYGGSSAPADPSQYSHLHITAQLVGLLDDLGAAQAVFVGQDFGAPATWQVALRAPERVAGLVLLSVPYDPRRMPRRPSLTYAAAAERHFLHTHYFQAPGVAEAELDARPREFLARLFHALSGNYHYLDIWGPGSQGVRGYLDVLPEAPPLPWPWLSVDEFEHYVAVFARTGFTGGLNWYRALDTNWEQDEPYAGKSITVPTLFIAGRNEPVIEMLGDQALARMAEHIEDYRGIHLLDGAGHWVQQERADEVSDLIVDFLQNL